MWGLLKDDKCFSVNVAMTRNTKQTGRFPDKSLHVGQEGNRWTKPRFTEQPRRSKTTRKMLVLQRLQKIGAER